MIAIATVTLDRRDLAVRCVGPSLARAGCDFRFYTWDNGSQDGVYDYVKMLPNCVFAYPCYGNIGYAKAANQMMRRAYNDGADFFMLLDPDILIGTDSWLATMVDVIGRVPRTGVGAVYCGVFGLHPLQDVDGVQVHVGDPFGPKMWTRQAIDEIGYLCEDYGLYGMEDRDWIWRLSMVNRVSYYVPGVSASHEGADVGHETEYRKAKWDALHATYDAHTVEINQARMVEAKSYYLPPPELMGE